VNNDGQAKQDYRMLEVTFLSEVLFWDAVSVMIVVTASIYSL